MAAEALGNIIMVRTVRRLTGISAKTGRHLLCCFWCDWQHATERSEERAYSPKTALAIGSIDRCAASWCGGWQHAAERSEEERHADRTRKYQDALLHTLLTENLFRHLRLFTRQAMELGFVVLGAYCMVRQGVGGRRPQ